MKTSCAGAIRGLWDELNQGLFPGIDDNIGELDAAHRLFMAVCEAVIRPREFEYAKWKGNGRPPARRPAAAAFADLRPGRAHGGSQHGRTARRMRMGVQARLAGE